MKLASPACLSVIVLAILATFPPSSTAGTSTVVEKSFEQYKELALKGDPSAQYTLGLRYHKGEGVAKDDVEAYAYLNLAGITDEEARKQRDKVGERLPPEALMRGQERTKALLKEIEAKKIPKRPLNDELTLGIENDDNRKRSAEVHFTVGLCYYEGKGTPKNLIEAAKEWRKAADLGYAPAMHNLGACYSDGEGVAKDQLEAVKWYRKAADQGYVLSQNILGSCYSDGEGVAKDQLEAVKWYRKAADQGYANAQYNLGVCYDKGEGVEKDAFEAVKWYRKAAMQGSVNAQFNLGVCYAKGNGVETDIIEAYALFSIASTSKESARNAVNALDKAMSPEAVSLGRQRAKVLQRAFDYKKSEK